MVRPTIRDVARQAECSVATVSRVLNGSARASPEVTARVRMAAEALGFRFNEIGRSLQSQRSRTLGVLVPTLANPVFADALEGVQHEAQEAGYQLLLACADYSADAEVRAVGMLLGKQVDGLLMTVTDAHDSEAVALARDAGVPTSLIFNQPDRGQSAVCVDNRAAAHEVGEALIALGHRNAAYVSGRYRSSDRARQRGDGFAAAFAAAGLPAPVLSEVDYNVADHTAAVAALLARAPETTALFCSNDMLAISVIGALRRLGHDVPGDMSVIGFDGITVGALVEPTLATVVTPCADMGRSAARLVLDAIEKKSAAASDLVSLPHSFRMGGSLAAVRPLGERRGRAAASEPRESNG
ncbi:MAG: substrate-binding domain-containing protein [Pseudomonadota bacterium]